MSPHLFRLMSPEDRLGMGLVLTSLPVRAWIRIRYPKDALPRKRNKPASRNWLLLQNSKGRKIPFSCHATHTRSKATPGTPDFWVGVNGHSMWIEFKRDHSCKLSPEQEEFRICCVCQWIECHLVYIAQQAIGIVERAAEPETDLVAPGTT
jgi:hypothetical protein